MADAARTISAVLAGSTVETLPQDVDRVVNALEYELGPPSPERKALAAAIAKRSYSRNIHNHVIAHIGKMKLVGSMQAC